MKKLLLYIAFLSSVNLSGQGVLHKDTILINEVVIDGGIMNDAPAGYMTRSVDSSVMMRYSNGTIAGVLTENPSVFIKSYGSGGTATLSFRGTGAGNTQVNWNGIRIDHPMLGQSDLSLIPAGMADAINIYLGGASLPYSGGGTGGMISLETRPEWKNGSSVNLNMGAGSFGKLSGLSSLRTGTSSFQSVTRFFLQGAENNFRYLDDVSNPSPEWRTRGNNDFYQKGLIQELYFKLNEGVLSARLWYQSDDRNLPASILAGQGGQGEHQYDESVRTMVSYNVHKGKSSYFITGAWMNTAMKYSNRIAAINSRNFTDSWIIRTGWDRNISGIARMKIVFSDELTSVRTNNYDTRTQRNTAVLTGSLESISAGRLNGTLLVRETADNERILVPDFSTGLQFRIIEGRDYHLKANFSRNSKVASMNDLYWLPGGNPDLRNEYSYIWEVDFEMKEKLSSLLGIKYDVSLYSNSIRDMIQWHPGEFSYWTATNIGSVRTRGLETSVSLEYKRDRLQSVFKAAYAYVNAADMDAAGSAKRQLIYTPSNQASTSLLVSYGRIQATWRTTFTGLRYTTTDNSGYLPAYLVNFVSAGMHLDHKTLSADLSLDVDNLFNTRYETIAWFPMPGRYYLLRLSLKFNNIKE